MNKTEFLLTIKSILKEQAFHKKGNYWYRQTDSFLLCIYVQGSQWNKNDYYVEIGTAQSCVDSPTPTITQWYCRHRCYGQNGELNILPIELFDCIDDLLTSIKKMGDVETYLFSKNAVKVATQYWF